MRRSTRTLLLLLLASPACDRGASGPVELPGVLRGTYGQRDEQAFHPIAGLQVDADALRFSELTIKIVAGEASGPDTFQVTRAEASWAKRADVQPKVCRGSIARQGDHLLLKLFDEGSDASCESALDGEWTAWRSEASIPEAFRGTYGADARSEDAAIGLRVGERRLEFTDGRDAIEVEELLVIAGEPDRALIRRARFQGQPCQGTMQLKKDEMHLELGPAAGAPEGFVCPSGHGSRWTVDAARLPKAPLVRGDARVEVSGERMVLRMPGDVRCEQTILRTAARGVSEAMRDGIPVPGGTIFVLAPAAAQGGAAGCLARVQGPDEEDCRRLNGGRSCSDEMLALTPPPSEVRCPTQVLISDPVEGGHKVVLMPSTQVTRTCLDTSGVFTPGS